MKLGVQECKRLCQDRPWLLHPTLALIDASTNPAFSFGPVREPPDPPPGRRDRLEVAVVKVAVVVVVVVGGGVGGGGGEGGVS